MPLENEAAYSCPVCFEQNHIGVDPSGGRHQKFIEDCPVCCNPIEFEVTIDPSGDVSVTRAEPAS
jgi:hypothetical protein